MASAGKGTMHVVVHGIRLFRETLGRCIEYMCYMISVFMDLQGKDD